MLSLLRQAREMMKGVKLENTNHCNFSYLVDNTGCVLSKCLLLPLLKKHLPFGQALGLRSHTTSMWQWNLLRFLLCFTFFAHRNVAGHRKHPQRAVVPSPFSPGLENETGPSWKWQYQSRRLSLQLRICFSADFASWHQFSRLNRAFSPKCWINKRSANGCGKNIQTGIRMQWKFSSLG